MDQSDKISKRGFYTQSFPSVSLEIGGEAGGLMGFTGRSAGR
jgi:hypothetical protein